jgi:hypothetical protein
MATTSLTVRYRPLRIGYLVPHGDVDALSRVAGISSLLWGGVYNPVIPVGADDALAKQLIRVFNVDALSPVGDTPALNALAAAHPFLRTPAHLGDELFFEDWQTKRQNVAVLDTIHPIRELWEKEFRHKPAGYRSNCALIEWSPDDPCALLFSLCFGHYAAKDDLRDDFKKAFLSGLKAQEIAIQRGAQLDPNLGNLLTPLELTRHKLRSYGRPWLRGPGLYVGDTSDFDDLVNFWNLRASGVEMNYLPLQHIGRFDAFTRAYLQELEALPPPLPEDMGGTGLHYKQGQEERAAAAIVPFQGNKPFLLCECRRDTWNGSNVHPTRNYFTWDNVLASVDRKFERFTVSFSLPEKPTDADQDSRYISFQHLVAVLTTTTEFEYPEHTLNPPFVRELNEFLSREIAVDPWKLRADPDGIALIIHLHDSSEWLYPVSHRELIFKIFELAGISAELSPAGLLADQIIRGMRETDPLEACRVFKIRGIRQLLKKGSDDNVTWEEAVRTIGQASFDKYKRLYIKARKTPQLTAQDAFSFLLEKNVFVPQLRWWPRFKQSKKPFRCKTCGLRSFVLMSVFEGKWLCEFCGREEHLPRLIGEEFKDKSEWRFRKTGFFAKENNQEGAIPVILTLLQMKRRLDTMGFMFSTALSLRPPLGNPCEVDLAVVQPEVRSLIELAFGECKDEGGRINEQDIANLRRVLDAFQQVRNVKPFLLFAKTADSFTPEEINLFRQLKADRVFPILFTNKELEPYDPYEEHRTPNLPFPYPFSLEQMAANSDYIYLR